MLRKTTVTVAIAGAGLASMSGAAFATTSHGSSSHDHVGTCVNNVNLVSKNGSSPVDVASGTQAGAPINICDVLNHTKILSDNTLTVGGTTTTIPSVGDLGGLFGGLGGAGGAGGAGGLGGALGGLTGGLNGLG